MGYIIKRIKMVSKIEREQWINIPIERAWEYFSSPNNLSEITPKEMGFIIKNNPPEEMYEGLMIEYAVKPLFSIPMKWITEIKYVHDQSYFVDEQRKGPYKMWHHEHHFKAVDGGVEVTDIVSYELPLGFLGRLVHPILVKGKLEEIFEYRFKKVEELFNQ